MSRPAHLLTAIIGRLAWLALAFAIALVPALACGGAGESPALISEQPAVVDDRLELQAANAGIDEVPRLKREPLPHAWSDAPRLRDGAPAAPEVSAANALILDEASLPSSSKRKATAASLRPASPRSLP